MASLLIVSADPQTAQQIELIATEEGLLVHSVNTIPAAQNWLNLNQFSMILVDARYEKAVELIKEGWKSHSFMQAGLFNPYGTIDDIWQAKLLGIRIYQGDEAFDGIKRTLSMLPDLTNLPEDKILLVEDLDAPRHIIAAYIESIKLGAVETAGDVEKALARLRNKANEFCCVITDINMPHINGIQFIEQVRHDPALNMIPIIVLTAYPSVDNLVGCVAAGATGFLVKPPKKQELKREVDKARRIRYSSQSPRICRPEDADLLKVALSQFVATV